MNVTGKNIKTIHSNIDIEIMDDVLHFHNKGNIFIDDKFYNRLVPHTLSVDQLHSLEKSDYEIVPFHDDEIQCGSDYKFDIKRNRSALLFNERKIYFEKIKALLTNSFSSKQDGSRPYPSGGALYPVEIICGIFSEKIIDGPPSGFYHYRPVQNILQPITQVNSEEMRHIIYNMESPEARTPHFMFLYVGVLGKMLVKYRYRGYRYALMEAGAMFQQADLVAQSLGLINKLYSGFNDHEIIKFIGLDRMNFIPYVIQSFGVQS